MLKRPLLTLVALLSSIGGPAASQAPAFRIARTQDLSYSNVVRLNIRVSVPQHYTRSQVEVIARVLVDSISRRRPVNAISVMLFGPGTSTDGAWDVAAVDWAPAGEWGNAGTVRAGDYRTFRYSVSYRSATTPPSATPSLAPSGQRGLLGAPLPRGASLISRTSADPSAGRDPSERYRIQASAAAIATFYSQELVKLGWSKDGTSTGTALFFTKGRQMLGVLINRDGGTFTLMGS